MKGSERRKAPQLSAAMKPQEPNKENRVRVSLYLLKGTLTEIKSKSIRLFGQEDHQAFIRLAISEKLDTMRPKITIDQIEPEGPR